MKENNNILIITRGLYHQDYIFKDIASIMTDGICTYYKSSFDIRNKNKHIKITNCKEDIKNIIESFVDKPNIIILDTYLDIDNYTYLFDYCCSITEDVIYIDFEDAKLDFFFREVNDKTLNILN